MTQDWSKCKRRDEMSKRYSVHTLSKGLNEDTHTIGSPVCEGSAEDIHAWCHEQEKKSPKKES